MKLGQAIPVKKWIVQSRDPLNPEWRTVEHDPRTRRKLSWFQSYFEADEARERLARHQLDHGNADVEYRVVHQ